MTHRAQSAVVVTAVSGAPATMHLYRVIRMQDLLPQAIQLQQRRLMRRYPPILRVRMTSMSVVSVLSGMTAVTAETIITTGM
jgi:hypothetical protein